MSGHFVRNGQRGSWISEGVAAFTNISLFSGAGGLDLGLRIAIRNLVTVCFVEREAYAAACLVARMEDKALDEAPVWDDITTFNGQRWRGCVDMLSGGFPCQDLSVAGKRAGIDGERSGLWSEFARLIGEIRPRYVFVENVPGLLNNEPMRRVLGDLAAFGFNAEWECVRASAVGAPHRRERVFILAMDDSGRERRQQESRSTHGDEEPHGPQNDHKSPGSDEGLADTDLRRLEVVWQSEQCREQCEFGRESDRCSDYRGFAWPPGPDDRAGWRGYLEHFPTAQPAVCRGSDGLAYRVDRLRLTGNGVVPLQAAAAFTLLHGRLKS